MEKPKQTLYYEKNKAIINEKRRLKYLEKKESTTKQIIQPKINIKSLLEPLSLNPNTQKKYEEDFKRLEKILEKHLPSIFTYFKKSKEVIDKLNNSKYSINTKKSLFQLILFLITKLNLRVNKKLYLLEFEKYKVGSFDENAEKIKSEELPSFKQYLENVEKTFGKNSKMDILTKLYNELPIRDNFILKIVPRLKDVTKEHNYIVVPKIGQLTIIINHYKTIKKYGIIKQKLSIELSKLIKSYIKTNKLIDYLFGNKPLTQFVSNSNKKMGYKSGINLLRHIKASEVQNSSPEDKITLAGNMRHAINTQRNYIRNKVTPSNPH